MECVCPFEAINRAFDDFYSIDVATNQTQSQCIPIVAYVIFLISSL